MPRRRKWIRWSRSLVDVQGRLAFIRRAERREQAFKRSIVALLALALVGLAAGTSIGRYAARLLTLLGLWCGISRSSTSCPSPNPWCATRIRPIRRSPATSRRVDLRRARNWARPPRQIQPNEFA